MNKAYSCQFGSTNSEILDSLMLEIFTPFAPYADIWVSSNVKNHFYESRQYKMVQARYMIFLIMNFRNSHSPHKIIFTGHHHKFQSTTHVLAKQHTLLRIIKLIFNFNLWYFKCICWRIICSETVNVIIPFVKNALVNF